MHLGQEIRGTGCILSTAISCFLSHGYDLRDAISKANRFTYHQIKNSQKIRKGKFVVIKYYTIFFIKGNNKIIIYG